MNPELLERLVVAVEAIAGRQNQQGEERDKVRKAYPLLNAGHQSLEVFHRMSWLLGGAPPPQAIIEWYVEMAAKFGKNIFFHVHDAASIWGMDMLRAEARLYFLGLLGLAVNERNGRSYLVEKGKTIPFAQVQKATKGASKDEW